MSSLAVQSFNGQTIRIRKEDRYVSLTDMAKASGKLFADWRRLKSSESYLEALSRSMGLPIDVLIEINESSGSNETRGSWGNSKVALRFAQWCSDEFAVQVDFWIDELVTTGKVELTEQKTKQPSELEERIEIFFVAQKVMDTISDRTLRSIALTQIDEDAKAMYGFSLYGYNEYESLQRGHEITSKKKEVPKKEVNLSGNIIEIDVDKNDLFYVGQIAKVINRITAGKAIKQPFCMSAMTSRNAALKAACTDEKDRLNNIMYSLIKIGILSCVGMTKKDTAYFQLVKRMSSEEIVFKYTKYMIGVAS